MNHVHNDQIRQNVRSRYKQIALQEVNSGSCCSASSGCCGTPNEVSAKLGYSDEELSAVPAGANLGLGCGNPLAIAELNPGEVVLDLGCGAGFDCFLAARQVGETGRVIGVDMTPEMISKARNNAAKGGYTNTEFRLGEIEYLPVAVVRSMSLFPIASLIFPRISPKCSRKMSRKTIFNSTCTMRHTIH